MNMKATDIIEDRKSHEVEEFGYCPTREGFLITLGSLGYSKMPKGSSEQATIAEVKRLNSEDSDV
jgi:hypothetical protein